MLATIFFEITFRLGRKGDKAVDIAFLEDQEFFEKASAAIREDGNLFRQEVKEALRLAAFGLTIFRNVESDFTKCRPGLELYFDHLEGLFISQTKKYRSAYCALCFKESCNIRQSHIVAKAILDTMMEGASITSIRLSNTPRKLLQYASAVCWYMLCGDCELSFGEIENCFVKEIFKPLYQDPDKERCLPAKPDSDGKLYFFFLSLGFRALRWLTSSESHRNIADTTTEVHLFMQALRGYLLTPATTPPPADIRVVILPTTLGDLHTVAYYTNRYLTGGCGWSIIDSHGQPTVFVHFGLIQVVVSSTEAFSPTGQTMPFGLEKPYEDFGGEVKPATPYLIIPATGKRQLSSSALSIVREQIAEYGKLIKEFPDSVLKQIAKRQEKGKPRTNRLRIAAISGDSRMKDALQFLSPSFVTEDGIFTLPNRHLVWGRTLCSTNEAGAKFIFHIGKGTDNCPYCIL